MRGLIPEMKKRGCTVLVHGATGRGNDQMRFERYTNVLAPAMQVYAPWRDAGLLTKFPGRTQMVDYLAQFGIKAFVGTKKKYSTDANLAGLSHEAEDLESLETAMTIVVPTMGVWRSKRRTDRERNGASTRAGPCRSMARMCRWSDAAANKLAGRNGIGMKRGEPHHRHQSRGVYGPPAWKRWPPVCAMFIRRRSTAARVCWTTLEAGRRPDLRRPLL